MTWFAERSSIYTWLPSPTPGSFRRVLILATHFSNAWCMQAAPELAAVALHQIQHGGHLREDTAQRCWTCQSSKPHLCMLAVRDIIPVLAAFHDIGFLCFAMNGTKTCADSALQHRISEVRLSHALKERDSRASYSDGARLCAGRVHLLPPVLELSAEAAQLGQLAQRALHRAQPAGCIAWFKGFRV